MIKVEWFDHRKRPIETTNFVGGPPRGKFVINFRVPIIIHVQYCMIYVYDISYGDLARPTPSSGHIVLALSYPTVDINDILIRYQNDRITTGKP